MSEHRTRTVRIVTGRPWKDAVVSVLQPRSSLRPWSTPDECEPGDAVVAVVDTDPVSVFSGISVVGPDRDIHNAIAGNHHLSRAGLLELSTVNMLTDLAICRGERSTYRGREATKLEKFLPGLTLPTVDALFGHTSLAAARVLLHADGRCTACSHYIDLTGEAARDRIEVHTADPYAEKPGSAKLRYTTRRRDSLRIGLPCCASHVKRRCGKKDSPAFLISFFLSTRAARSAVGSIPDWRDTACRCS